MIIDGIYGSEMIDSSGEVLEVEGTDISDWELGTMLLDWEHEPGEKGASTLVGKTIYCRKIYKESDCENDRQRMYWNKVKVPFIYGVARLFDTAGHAEAKNIAAIIRDSVKNNEPIVVRFSVEGHTLKRDGQRLKETVVKRIAVTVKPCNRTAVSGVLSDEQAPSGFSKEPEAKAKGALDDVLKKLGQTEKGERDPNLFDRLGGSEFETNPLVEDEELAKATEAGGYGGSPSSLTGGSALQVEDRALRQKKLAAVCKAIARDYQPGSTPFRDYAKAELAKANMPEVSDEFLDHFTNIVDQVRAKLRKADGDAPAKPKVQVKLPKGKEPERKLPNPEHAKVCQCGSTWHPTFRGQPLKPNLDLKPTQVDFNDDTGELRTHMGTFQCYNPDNDPQNPHSGAAFHSIWHSAPIRKVHDYAFAQWHRLHQDLKHGNLKQATIATAVMFSMLSPQTPVPIHEMMAAYLRDANKEAGFDSRDPRFGKDFVPGRGGRPHEGEHFHRWVGKDQPQGLPQHSRDYFQNEINQEISNEGDSKVTGRMAGDRTPFAMAPSKFESMARYSDHHAAMVDIARRHGVDSRSAIAEMMSDRAKDTQWKAARDRQTMPTTGDRPGNPGVYGLSIKTARFAYNMFGGGNTFVPDTHFVRHFFGLDARDGGDVGAIEYLKQRVMWNEGLTDLHGRMDQWYNKNHPSVRYTRERWPEVFKSDPEQAIFPAFWAHWISIGQHEAALGIAKTPTDNQKATHRPMFDEAQEHREDPAEAGKDVLARHFNRAKPEDAGDANEQHPQVGDPLQAAREWRQVIKENPAPKGAPAANPFKRIRLPGDPPSQPYQQTGGTTEDVVNDLWGLQKAESVAGGPLLHPVHAAFLMRDWVDQLGPAGASLRFFMHLAPLLNPDSSIHPGVQLSGNMPQRPSLLKFEALAIEVARLAALFKAQERNTRELSPHTDANEPIRSSDVGNTSDQRAAVKQHDGESPPTANEWGNNLPPAPQQYKNNGTVDAQIHGIHELNTSPEQQKLIHGLDFRKLADGPGNEQYGISDPRWLNHPDGRLCIVKDDDAGTTTDGPRLEVAYHNMARDYFGLGQHVPVTAAFRHPVTGEETSAQEAVDGDHMDMKRHEVWGRVPSNEQQISTLRRLHIAGTTDKLHLMNLIMGNSDRHGGNYLLTNDEAGIKLIDHGHAFKSYGREHLANPIPAMEADAKAGRPPVKRAWQPAYTTHVNRMLLNDTGIDHLQQPIHTDAHAWLHSLDERGLMDHLRANGVPWETVSRALTTLQKLKAATLEPGQTRFGLYNHPSLRYDT